MGGLPQVHRALRVEPELRRVAEEAHGQPERFEAFLPLHDEMVQEGMMTLEKVRIIDYRAAGGS